MVTPSHARRLAVAARASRAAAATAIAVGGLALVGWALDVEVLRSGVPGLTAMNPGGTALTFLLAGVALWVQRPPAGRWHRRVGRASAAAVTVISATRLAGYFVGWDGGPDRWLFAARLAREAEAGRDVNRMAPNTAAAFLALGPALWLVGARGKRAATVAQALALFVA